MGLNECRVVDEIVVEREHPVKVVVVDNPLRLKGGEGRDKSEWGRRRKGERVREEEKGNFRKLKASPRCHFSTSEQVADNRQGN